MVSVIYLSLGGFKLPHAWKKNGSKFDYIIGGFFGFFFFAQAPSDQYRVNCNKMSLRYCASSLVAQSIYSHELWSPSLLPIINRELWWIPPWFELHRHLFGPELVKHWLLRRLLPLWALDISLVFLCPWLGWNHCKLLFTVRTIGFNHFVCSQLAEKHVMLMGRKKHTKASEDDSYQLCRILFLYGFSCFFRLLCIWINLVRHTVVFCFLSCTALI